MASPLYIGEDHYVRFFGANDSADSSYLNSATVTFTLKTTADVTVSGPTPMDYIAASNGNYRGILDSAVTSGLTLDAGYYLYIDFDQGNYEGKRRLTCVASYRGQT